jgi:hypothetical protein
MLLKILGLLDQTEVNIRYYRLYSKTFYGNVIIPPGPNRLARLVIAAAAASLAILSVIVLWRMQ